MSPFYGTGRELSIWCLLSVVLFLGIMAFVERLAPEIETNTQDEQALETFSYALKSDGAGVGSGSAMAFVLNESDDFSGVSFRQNPLQQGKELLHFKPTTLRLHQRLSTYRI